MDKETEEALGYIKGDVAFARKAYGHFLEAMKDGYANAPTKGTNTDLPGSKTIEYTHARWRVLDTYFVAPQSQYSGGSTIIWYGPVPVWMMQYLGYYEPEAIPCLKAALKRQYESGTFNGGRGPSFFHRDGLTYINRVEENHFLGRSCGEEYIFDAAGKLGWHRYQSTYMIQA